MLTPRQRETWELMRQRKTHVEMAYELQLGRETIRKYIAAIWDKICVNGHGEDLLKSLTEGEKGQ
jgi:DNA-binding CsgD family transcriptional regulator